jgi:hypothetical protein
MLQTWFVPQLRVRGLEVTAVLCNKMAHQHAALSPVREYPNNKFSGRWTGRGSDMVWPPRSPDITTCDNSLWGIVKEKIYQLRLATVADLAVRNCFNQFQLSAWKKMSRRTLGKIKTGAENGEEFTDNF